MLDSTEGRFTDRCGSDSGQQIRDTLARLETGQAVIAAALAELAEQMAGVMEAEAILRRAQFPAAPRRLRPVPRRETAG